LYALDDRALQMLRSAGFNYWPEAESDRGAFRGELLRIKRELNAARRRLRIARRTVRQRPSPPAIRGGAGADPGLQSASISELVRRTEVGIEQLRAILAEPSREKRQTLAREYYEPRAERFSALGSALAAEFKSALDDATDAVQTALGGP